MIRRGPIQKLPVNDIVVTPDRWRQPTHQQIEAMRESLRENGLLTPIGVRLVNRECRVVHGATRLAAARAEGWPEVDVQMLEGSDVEAEMAEIAENVHRGELTRLERDRQLARYAELCKSAQSREPRAKPKRGRHQGGVRAVARRLNVPESTARDAIKAASITPAAAAEITNLRLANSPAAYREIAAEPTTEAQIAKARAIANGKKQPALEMAAELTARQLAALQSAWRKAGQEARRKFLMSIGQSQYSPGGSEEPDSTHVDAEPAGGGKDCDVQPARQAEPEQQPAELMVAEQAVVETARSLVAVHEPDAQPAEVQPNQPQAPNEIVAQTTVDDGDDGTVEQVAILPAPGGWKPASECTIAEILERNRQATRLGRDLLKATR
jgi:ParB/RepB/Spo0J family partition protein